MYYYPGEECNPSENFNSEDINEILPHLFISDAWTAGNLDLLVKHKITHILTVAKGISPKFKDHFNYKIVEVEDYLDQDLKQHCISCCEYIQQAIDNGGTVLVHCSAGRSRSGGIVCAYLIWR